MNPDSPPILIPSTLQFSSTHCSGTQPSQTDFYLLRPCLKYKLF